MSLQLAQTESMLSLKQPLLGCLMLLLHSNAAICRRPMQTGNAKTISGDAGAA